MTEAIELARARPARHLLVVCALLSSAARFVPVPFLDDILRERIRQYLVSRLLRGSGRSFGSARVGALWKDAGGCASGCLALAWKIPLKLILFPIRKIIAIVSAVQGFARDVTESLLFGRALDRALARGLLPEGASDAELASQSVLVKSAFDRAVQGADTALVGGALAEALRGVKGLPKAALRTARSLVRSEAPADPEAAASAEDRQVVEQGAGAVEAALERADVARALADFDARFDAGLGA